MSETNMTTSGSGTARDPYTFNYHTTAQSRVAPHWVILLFCVVIVLAVVGFLAMRRRKSN